MNIANGGGAKHPSRSDRSPGRGIALEDLLDEPPHHPCIWRYTARLAS